MAAFAHIVESVCLCCGRGLFAGALPGATAICGKDFFVMEPVEATACGTGTFTLFWRPISPPEFPRRAQTLVPVEQRRVFLGRMAAPMLALAAEANPESCGAHSPAVGVSL